MQLTVAFVAGLLASASLSVAAPAPETGMAVPLARNRRAVLTHPDGKINWSKVKAHNERLKAKYATSLNNYQRNTGKVHSLASTKPVVKRATGSVPLTDQENEELWTGKTGFGSQTFPIDFDTGSADTLVNKGAYTPGSTSVKTSQTFSTAYGDGTTAKGTVYQDTLHIGGLTATKASIGLSTTTFIDSSEGSVGISGLSYPSLSTFGKYLPFFDTLINQGVVSSPVFGFRIATSSAELYLGGTNSNHYSGSFSYASVIDGDGFWGVSSSIVGVSTESIIDSGTTVIVAPTDTAQDIFDTLGVDTFTQDGSLYGSYDCSSPPSVYFTIAGKRITLSSSTVSFGTANDGSCVLSIIGEDVGIDAVIAGDSFMQNAYVAFDRGNNRVGFATPR